MEKGTRGGFQHAEKRDGWSIHAGCFDPEAPTDVIADTSPVRLGAVLVQEVDRKRRAVCYTIRSLIDKEHRYSPTEKKALALVWSWEIFNLYLYGLPDFDQVTDHQALKTI